MTSRGGHTGVPVVLPDLASLRHPALLLVPGLVATCWLVLALVAGRFNDGGWYLLVARRVLEGAVLYQDVPFPHPPGAVMVYLPAVALASGVGVVLVGRLLAACLSALGLAAAVLALPPGRARRAGLAAAVVLAALDPYAIYFLSQVKAYPPATLALGATLLALARGSPGLAGLALGLGLGTRLSLVAALPALLLADRDQAHRALLGTLLGTGLVYLPAAILAGAAAADQFYVPMVGFSQVNGMTDAYLSREVAPGLVPWVSRVLGSLGRTLWTHPLALLLAWRGATGRPTPAPSAGAAARRFAGGALLLVGAAHLLARRPYDDYQLVLAPLVVFLAGLEVARWGARAFPRKVAVGIATAVAVAVLLGVPRGLDRFELRPRAALLELAAAAEATRTHTTPGQPVLSLDPYLVVASGRPPVPGLELGRFGLRRPGEATRRGSVSLAELCHQLVRGGPGAVWLPANEDDPLDPVRALGDATRAGGYRPVARIAGYGEQGRAMILWGRR